MPRNGSGVYTPPNGTLAVTLTTISSPAYDTYVNDISAEMTNSVNVQGTAPMLAALDVGGHKVKNMALGTLATDAATFYQVQHAVPTGAVFHFAATSPPTGFLECDGSSISTTTYADLFAVVGYAYGGAGANFNLPDLRAQIIRGWDHGAGVDTGRTFGSLQADITGPHAHNISDPGHLHQLNANLTRQAVGAGADALGTFGGGVATTTAFTGITIQSVGSGIGSETRVKNIALLPCIKT